MFIIISTMSVHNLLTIIHNYNIVLNQYTKCVEGVLIRQVAPLQSKMSICDAMRCDAMRCDAMRCDAMRCDAMRCDAMRCDAMRCDAMRCDAMRCDAMRCDSIT